MTLSLTDSQNLILSYLITFAIYNLGGFASSDILLGVIFVSLYFALSKARKDDEAIDYANLKKYTATAHILSAIWTFLYYVYASDRLGGGMENRLFSGVYTLLTLIGIYMMLYFGLRRILAALVNVHPSEQTDGFEHFPYRLMLIYTGLIIICLLPLFLLNFPGTMTVDSFNQLSQARGIEPYTDQHPWVHTLIIKALFNMGYAFTGSVYGGIAAYTVVQMVLCALAVSYAICSLAEAGAGRGGRILLWLGYVLYPYNEAYAITMWKDVLFGASVLVLIITIYRLWCREANKEQGMPGKTPVRDWVIFGISGLGTCLLRHNGYYAFILTLMVIAVYALRTKANRIPVLIAACIVILTAVIKGPIQDAYQVGENAFAYNLPIPLQQIAYVIHNNGDISPSDMEMIERINISEYLRNEYTPGGADPTEQWLIFGDSAYLESHKAQYLGLWIRIGLKNPIAYLRAYADITRGYYTTMLPEQTEFYGILPNHSGLEPKPVLGATIRIKVNEIVYKLHRMLPVYAILYSPGACFQLLMLGICVIILRGGSYQTLLVYLPVVAIILTVMIATPLAADLRYAYPLMISMPALIAITLL